MLQLIGIKERDTYYIHENGKIEIPLITTDVGPRTDGCNCLEPKRSIKVSILFSVS